MLLNFVSKGSFSMKNGIFALLKYPMKMEFLIS